MSLLDGDDLPLAVDFDQFLQSSASAEPSAPPLRPTDDINVEVVDDASDLSLEDECLEYQDLLEEAHKYYGKNKPAFCVADKGEKTRTVKSIRTNEEAELVFCTWLGGRWGYWVFTDPNEDKHICKFQKGYYYVWQGISSGFDKQAIAQAISSPNKRERSPTVLGDTQQNISSPARPLRKRTARQQMPYAMYRLQQQNQKRGIHASETQLELSLLVGSPNDQATVDGRDLKQEFVSGIAVEASQNGTEMARDSTSLSSSCQSDTVKGKLNNSTSNAESPASCNGILRSRVDASTGPSVPLYLATIRTGNHLFESLRQRWGFRLGQQVIEYCIVKFPWLDDNHSLYLQPNDEDSFRLLCDEIQHASEHKKGGLVDADLELRTKP